MILDDLWIREHFDGANTAALCREYNSVHGTSLSKDRFNWYCKTHLGLVSRGRKYTDEEKAWLKENYPTLGGAETARQFTKRFGRNVSHQTIKTYCSRWLKTNVSDEWRRQYQESRSVPIGTLTVNSRGDAIIKTEKGWIKATHANVDVPKGMVAFNLDGNILDNSAENIGVTTQSKFRTLRNYGMWSNEREITRTGLLVLDLKELIETGDE